VWGLDDYHCLPFYFGACQMQADGGDYSPAAIHNDSVLKREGDTYLYFGCIRYIKSLKKGVPFFEHSPMLNDISQLQSWQKVASGLLKLFEGEVLSKRQVVQHLVFKNIFAADWTPSEAPRETPTQNFRSPGALGPMVRAPWADEPNASGMAPTKAPWAK
jgi:Phosphotyrosyl phosphate activator (PTPA) protein